MSKGAPAGQTGTIWESKQINTALDYNPLNKIRIYEFILTICKYINDREAQWESSMVEKNGRVWRWSGYLHSFE